MMTQEAVSAKSRELNLCVEGLQEIIVDALEDGTAVHQVEKQIWTKLLQTGRACLTVLLDLLGTGDQSETYTTEDGRALR